jgi:hypothetical protein
MGSKQLLERPNNLRINIPMLNLFPTLSFLKASIGGMSKDSIS